MCRRLKPLRDGCDEIAKYKSYPAICKRVGGGAEEVQSQKLQERHFHASRKRRGHRIKSWNELGYQQRCTTALEERFGGPQDARFRINRDSTEKSQQPPSHAVAKYVEQRVSYQHRHHGSKHCR